MPIRKAELLLFRRDGEDPGHAKFFEKHNYGEVVKAVCTLNYSVEAFHVYEYEPLLFGKNEIYLEVDLPSVKRGPGRKMGRMKFDTVEAAVEYGRDFVRQLFPEVTPDMLLKNEE